MGEFADVEHGRRVFQVPLEREHESNKRRAIRSSPRGGLVAWEDLPPMAQHAFAQDVALPRVAEQDGLEPSPWRLAHVAPITWEELGPSFGTAFQARHERQNRGRQWGIRSDISVCPDRDASNPENDPCVHCHIMGRVGPSRGTCGCDE